MNASLRDAVAAFANQVTPETVEMLAREVERTPTPDGDLPSRVAAQFADPAVRHSVSRLLESWLATASSDHRLLAESLRTAAAASRWRDAHERLELVWSGPLPAGSNFRRSDEALLQVVRSAQRRLSVVTFAAYRVPSIAAALRDALARGIEVRFFGETLAGSEGRVRHDAAAALGAGLADRIVVFEWPLEMRATDARSNRGLLHAKFALADDTTLFVSSANLTEAALDANMELGVLVSGGTLPSAVGKHVDRLIAEGYLRAR
ncbi:MAG: hypothetical protein IT348_00370 [Candidatus Eisenbacteria bacterium]|nr:hypothetical protein [Candidatus Eisenbacteria bacterium]